MDGTVDRLPHAGSAGLMPLLVAPDQYDASDGDHDSSDEHDQAHRIVMAGSDSARAVGARTDRHDETVPAKKFQTANWRKSIASTPDTIEGVTKTAARPHLR